MAKTIAKKLKNQGNRKAERLSDKVMDNSAVIEKRDSVTSTTWYAPKASKVPQQVSFRWHRWNKRLRGSWLCRTALRMYGGIRACVMMLCGPDWKDLFLTVCLVVLAGYAATEVILHMIQVAGAQEVGTNCSISFVTVPGPVITVSLVGMTASTSVPSVYYLSINQYDTRWLNSIALLGNITGLVYMALNASLQTLPSRMVGSESLLASEEAKVSSRAVEHSWPFAKATSISTVTLMTPVPPQASAMYTYNAAAITSTSYGILSTSGSILVGTHSAKIFRSTLRLPADVSNHSRNFSSVTAKCDVVVYSTASPQPTAPRTSTSNATYSLLPSMISSITDFKTMAFSPASAYYWTNRSNASSIFSNPSSTSATQLCSNETRVSSRLGLVQRRLQHSTTKVIVYGGYTTSFVFPPPNISTTVSYWTGVYPTLIGPMSSGLDRRQEPLEASSATVNEEAQESTTRTSVALLRPGPTLCGESGNFTLNFDDMVFSEKLNGSDTLMVSGIRNPYHHLFYGAGFISIADAWEPYAAVSQPNVAMFLPLSGQLSPSLPFAGTMLPGEFGAGPRASVDAYWFHAYSGYFGCGFSGISSCTLRIVGYRYDGASQQEVVVAEQNVTLAACWGYRNCLLTQIFFNKQFRGLSGMQLHAFVYGLPVAQMHVMDDLHLGWYNNSCAAGIQRLGHS